MPLPDPIVALPMAEAEGVVAAEPEGDEEAEAEEDDDEEEFDCKGRVKLRPFGPSAEDVFALVAAAAAAASSANAICSFKISFPYWQM